MSIFTNAADAAVDEAEAYVDAVLTLVGYRTAAVETHHRFLEEQLLFPLFSLLNSFTDLYNSGNRRYRLNNFIPVLIGTAGIPKSTVFGGSGLF